MHMSYLGQDLIIDNMNSYLKKELMSSKVLLNEGGVCNGLAMLYAQYALQGSDKEADFFTLLDLIARNKMHEETAHGFPSGYCLHFASQILLAFEPSDFEQRLTQSTSMNILEINNKPLTSSFDFALSTDDRSWCDIFGQIQLQADEVMIVHSINHAIAVRKESHGYVVYDPNYTQGIKRFANEHALVRELHKKVFNYNSGAMGLTLHIIRHPNASVRIPSYPEYTSLYKQFLSEKLKSAQTGSKQFHSFKQAAGTVRNAQAIEQLITCCKPDSAELFEAAQKAVVCNNDVALPSLLNALNTTSLSREQFTKLVEFALAAGRLEVFKLLIREKEPIYCNQDAGKLILYAVQGGNPEILTSLITEIVPQLLESYYEDIVLEHMKDRYSDFSTDSAVLFKQINTDRLVTNKLSIVLKAGLVRAAANGHVECITLLTKELKFLGAQLDEKEWLQCLMAAISRNQEHALNALIKINPNVSMMLLSQITLSVVIAANSDLGLLHSLKDNGLLFSAEVDDVFKKKQENHYYSIHILLMLLIGYIQKKFGKEQIIHNEEQLIDTKKAECQDLINKMKSDYPDFDEADAAFLNTQQQNLDNDMDFSRLNGISTLLKEKASKLSVLHAARQHAHVAYMSLDEYLEDEPACIQQTKLSI